MAKKKGNAAKTQAKAAKKAKVAAKVEKKEKKKSKNKDVEDDDEDLEGILEKMRRDWEEAHKVTEELVEGPPSRRANATLTACPNGNHLWCIGGEFFSDDNKAYFYNDVFRYSPEKDEWRKFVSQTCPGPRSAHAVVATPAGGGKIFLFGGEFSSLHQNTFHHYGDFWCFDITTHSWDRIDTKVRPSPRSGHRMAFWKHYIVLFGGFYDPGITTRYHNDLWIFDTQEYNWRQIEFRENESKPSPRSGFSFLPCTDGILLHGGYCKEYAKGKRPVGVMLEDTWFLHMSINTPTDQPTSPVTSKSSKSKVPVNPLVLKWERRKKPSYAPSQRSGCTMALWASKNQGILFGGVTDEDRHEETLDSVFWNDLYGYQISGKGRWVSMALKRPKKKGGAAKKKQKNAAVQRQRRGGNDSEDDDEDASGLEEEEDNKRKKGSGKKAKVEEEPAPPPAEEIDPDDPILTTPIARYNAMLSVLRNTLYIYGGIFERGSKEYTLDDFYSLALDKLDTFVCLKPSSIVIDEGEDESSSEDEDDDDDDDEDSEDEEDEGDEGSEDGDRENGDGDEVEEKVQKKSKKSKEEVAKVVEEPVLEEIVEEIYEQEPESELRTKATEFMGVSKDATRSPEDVISTPLPGETLAMFYARSREHWSQKAFSVAEGDTRGKQLRQEGFELAKERYESYKPILEEVEKILAEAGLDEAEMRRVAAAGPAKQGVTQSRNRR